LDNFSALNPEKKLMILEGALLIEIAGKATISS
jgi:hypothetical protein